MRPDLFRMHTSSTTFIPVCVRERHIETERDRERVRKRERVCVYLCMCVCERKSDTESRPDSFRMHTSSTT